MSMCIVMVFGALSPRSSCESPCSYNIMVKARVIYSARADVLGANGIQTAAKSHCQHRGWLSVG
eukprot:COSAG01_NODE_6233_length_3777_cov_2.172648_5_plen_64_part_00